MAAGYDTINGLVVSTNPSVEQYYNDNVKGGVNAFVEAVAGFDDFENAIIAKLEKEIVIPIPGAVWLFGTGLVALFGFARRNRTATVTA